MKTLLKWVAVAFGTMVVLSIALGLLVLLLVDPNDYREQIAAAVEEQTGRKLTIDGELDLEVFPCCGVGLGPLALGNPPGWQQQKFAEVGRAEIDVKVLPLLLRQELQVGEIRLEGLELRLIRRSDGLTNWEFDSDSAADDDADGDDPESAEPRLDIAGIRVTNGKIEYVDNTAGDQIRLANINLEAGRIRSGVPFEFSAGVDADGLLEDTNARVRLTATAELPEQEVAALLTDIELTVTASGPDLPDSGAEVTLSMERVSGLGADVVQVDGLELDIVADAMRAQLSGAGQLAGTEPRFSGKLSIPPFALRKLLDSLGDTPVATADPDALSRFELTGDWAVRGDTAVVENLAGQLDQTRLSGFLKVLSIEREALGFDLQLDTLDADRYLAPADEADGGAAAASSGDEQLDLPLNQLRALDLNGRLRIGALTFSGARLADVDVTIGADTGLIALQPLTAKLYGGTYAGNVRLNVRGNVPRLAVNERLRNVQVRDLLGDVGSAAPLSGLANLTIQGDAAGNTVNALISQLQGDVKFDLQDATYSGADLWYEIRKARALIKQEPAPAAPANPVTRLQTLAGSLQFADGKLQNRDFAAAMEFLQLSGSGAVNLLDGSLDYGLRARVTETPVFADGTRLDKLTGLTLPVSVTGTLTAPEIGVDAQGLATELLQQKGREKLLEKLGLDAEAEAEPGADGATEPAADPKDEAKDRVKDKLRDLLGG
ncbi:MAG: AsmA family protein [Gammaproteobacteria bacterium]|jgi:AsmA protein|nr:AsmA family protein [Gammaproteobacteria bacterium]